MPVADGSPDPAVEIGILALVPDRWQAPWQPRHHVLSRLARTFPVVWVEPAHHWRSPAGERVVPQGPLEIYTPEWWLPNVHRPAALARILHAKRLERARRRLVEQGCKRIVLYVWRPDFASALDLIHHDLCCYHIDDEYSFSREDTPISPEEMTLLRRAGLVIIHSPRLIQKKGSINPNTLFVPNGVDYRAFATPVQEPPQLAAIPSPRIGYTGYIKNQLDFDLLLDLARRHPRWSFVLTGPGGVLSADDARALAALQSLENVYFPGAQPVQALPAFTQWVDVGIMPYKRDAYTQYIFPMKLNEYLATGRPVVGSRIPSLERFDHVVSVPQSLDQWSSALEASLAPEANTPERIAMRKGEAARHDWDALVQRISTQIQACS